MRLWRHSDMFVYHPRSKMRQENTSLLLLIRFVGAPLFTGILLLREKMVIKTPFCYSGIYFASLDAASM